MMAVIVAIAMPQSHNGCMPSRPATHRPYLPARLRQHRTNHATYDANRPNAYQRGYDDRWRAARLAWLTNHPLCAECSRQGRITAAGVVDHILPHRGDAGLFWDEGNWQSLCKRCHNAKTGRGE